MCTRVTHSSLFPKGTVAIRALKTVGYLGIMVSSIYLKLIFLAFFDHSIPVLYLPVLWEWSEKVFWFCQKPSFCKIRNDNNNNYYYYFDSVLFPLAVHIVHQITQSMHRLSLGTYSTAEFLYTENLKALAFCHSYPSRSVMMEHKYKHFFGNLNFPVELWPIFLLE